MAEPLRVLLVEDSEDDTALLLRELQRAGYDPTYRQVETAAEMLAALEEQAWDIIVADYTMPQFSGLAALRLYQARRMDLPFILVSGTVGEEEAVVAMKAGAHDYLLKDNLKRLAPAVQRELREASVRRERRRAEARLTSILATAADAIIGVDESWRIVFFNQGAERIFGYAASEVIGQSLDLLLPGDPATVPVKRFFKPVLSEAEGSFYGDQLADEPRETLARRKDGTQFPAEASISKFSQDEGTYFTVIVRDISDRKRAEAALRQADRRAINQYRQLLEHLAHLAQAFGAAPDLPAVYRALHQFVETSAPCDALFISLYDPEQRLRTCVYFARDGVPPPADDVSELPGPLPLNDCPQSRAIKSGDVVVVNDFQTAGAGRPEVNLGDEKNPRWPQSSVAVPMSVMSRVIGVFDVQSLEPAVYRPEHVTALRMAANLAAVAIENVHLLQQTRAQARQVQQVIDTMPEGVLLLDTSHRLLLANPIARQYLLLLADTGVEGGERGSPPPPLTHLGGRPLAEVLASIPAGASWRGHELILPEAQRVFEIAAQPITTEAGAAGWVVVLRDVTEKRSQQEYLQTQDRLATVGQLAAGIAHDFNNIMAIITLYSGTLASNPNHPKREHYLTTISDQARHAANLIGQILDFSRSSVMDRARLDLLPFVKEVVKLLKRTVPENIAIQLAAAEATYPVEADPTRLQQVLMNLAVNARDAITSAALSTGLKGGELRLTLSRLTHKPGEPPPLPNIEPGHWICLAVQDTGAGIPPEALPHIFEPFFTTKRPGKGTGLGLAQVYGIVKQHGGEIGVASRPGRGTTFSIFLPALEEVGRGTEGLLELHPGGSSPTATSRETILLVEDDEATREAIRETLEMLDYRVLEASTGREALIAFEEHKEAIDLVLTDMVMPEMGGFAFYQALKSRQPGIKAVVMTGYPLADEERTLLEQGIVDWIQKPFSGDTLGRKMRQVLAK